MAVLEIPLGSMQRLSGPPVTHGQTSMSCPHLIGAPERRVNIPLLRCSRSKGTWIFSCAFCPNTSVSFVLVNCLKPKTIPRTHVHTQRHGTPTAVGVQQLLLRGHKHVLAQEAGGVCPGDAFWEKDKTRLRLIMVQRTQF
jgi:hypothetical protein